jgi:hypothetical protein
VLLKDSSVIVCRANKPPLNDSQALELSDAPLNDLHDGVLGSVDHLRFSECQWRSMSFYRYTRNG